MGYISNDITNTPYLSLKMTNLQLKGIFIFILGPQIKFIKLYSGK